ncbi:MAG: GNAT family N-acetyltransferase [Rhodospirillaceae bacterium]
MTIRNLDYLFRPKSVAVIGASARGGNLGHAVFQSLRRSGFHGLLYAINPKGGEIEGESVLPSLADLPAVPDLAVIVTPPPTVPAIVSELGAMGCKAGVVLSAGFGEGQDRQGQNYREALLAAARPHLFRIVGPNCLGVMVPALGLNASFVRTPALSGRLALVAQSGAIAAAVLDWAEPRHIGFSHVVTLGDMADVDFGDMLDYLAADPNTQAILLYIEGVTQPRKFMSAARRTARLKPVIAVKAGRQAESAKAATSHTGALAGADAVYDAVFARAGILRVDDLDDLFSVAELLALTAPVAGDRLTIVTNGGGLGVLAADRLIGDHGRLAVLSNATREKLDKALPPTWSRGNPIDIIGDATPERYRHAVAAALHDPENDGVLVLHCPTSACDPRAAAKVVADLATPRPAKPLLTAWTGEASVREARADLARAHVATFPTPGAAVSGFMQLVRYRKLQDLLLETPPAHEAVKPTAVQDARAVISQLTEARWLPVDAVKRLLRLYGIPTNRSATASTPADAKRIAADWRCRVALKIHSPDIVHKSDVNGVVLDVDPSLVEVEAQQMLEAVHRRMPQARLEGLLVEEMVKRPDAQEVFIGMASDPTFGPVIAFGQGGTGIEVIDDKSFGLPPLNMNLAAAMIAETRVGRLLAGYRNRPPANTTAIAQALVSLSQLVADHPVIKEIDLNPLLVDASGLIAVDARIRVDPGTPDSRLIISPYPREFERTLTRSLGPPLHVRPLQPQDTRLVEEFIRRLSPEDRRFRFFAALRGLDHALAARLCQLDYDRELALIATLTPAGKDIVGIARFHADPDNTEAEFAIAVRTDLQKQGIGFALLTYLSELAAARGIQRLWGVVLPDNAQMLGLAKALGMQLTSSSLDNTVRVTRDLTANR